MHNFNNLVGVQLGVVLDGIENTVIDPSRVIIITKDVNRVAVDLGSLDLLA